MVHVKSGEQKKKLGRCRHNAHWEVVPTTNTGRNDVDLLYAYGYRIPEKFAVQNEQCIFLQESTLSV